MKADVDVNGLKQRARLLKKSIELNNDLGNKNIKK